MSTGSQQLVSVHQDPATCVIKMADGTAVIFEEDGTITLNLPSDDDREPPIVSSPRHTPRGRYGPGGTRFTIKRDRVEGESQ